MADRDIFLWEISFVMDYIYTLFALIMFNLKILI